MEITGISLAHWADGKVLEEWIEFDIGKLREQMGYTIIPPPGMEAVSR